MVSYDFLVIHFKQFNVLNNEKNTNKRFIDFITIQKNNASLLLLIKIAIVKTESC